MSSDHSDVARNRGEQAPTQDNAQIRAIDKRLGRIEDRLDIIEDHVGLGDRRKGFRLIELIYVLAIIATLIAAGLYFLRIAPGLFERAQNIQSLDLTYVGSAFMDRIRPRAVTASPANELSQAAQDLQRANALLAQHGLTWPDISTGFEAAEAKARLSAYEIMQRRTRPAQDAILERIETEFVDPYFSLGGDITRSLGCIFRAFNCDQYIEEDFERHFSGIDDSELLGAWRRATLPVLERYDSEKRTYLQTFSLRNDLNQDEFTEIMNGLTIEPTEAAAQYAEEAGLLENGALKATSNFLGTTAFSLEVYETIRERAIIRARQQALARANQRASQFAGQTLAGGAAAGRSAAVKLAGRATIVIGIAMEIIAEVDRINQRDAMMYAFRSKLQEEENNYFLEAIAYANAASYDKDIITAIKQIPPNAEV